MNPDDRELTERDRLFWQHRNCECGGMGLARRYRRAPGVVVGRSIILFCRCAAGRWVKARHEEGPPAAGRVPDLADYPWLWNSCLTPPGATPVHDLRDLPGVAKWVEGLNAPARPKAPPEPVPALPAAVPAPPEEVPETPATIADAEEVVFPRISEERVFPRLADIQGGRRRVPHPIAPRKGKPRDDHRYKPRATEPPGPA
jgi:hypothetical protein